MENLIICKKEICAGNPCIKGRRLTVYNIVVKVYLEDNIDLIYEDYELSNEEVKQAINYCSNLECINDSTLISFCDGCILGESDEIKSILDTIILYRDSNDKNDLDMGIKSYFLDNNIDIEKKSLNLGWDLANIVKIKVC
jgi:uncharacterized protein (DUF433 family)